MDRASVWAIYISVAYLVCLLLLLSSSNTGERRDSVYMCLLLLISSNKPDVARDFCNFGFTPQIFFLKQKNQKKYISHTHTFSMKLDPWQEEFLNTKGDKILCTGRQVGKSVICARDAAQWAVKPENKGQNVLMIAPTERQARALFEKTLDYLLTNFPKLIKKGKDKPTKEKITLTNKVRIYCLPTGLSGTGIRFLTVGRLYVDEASQVPEDVWAAVTPMLLTTGGDSIYLSTPFGAQGEFYRCWINKDNAYNSFSRFSVTSEIAVAEREICETWTLTQREKALQKIEQAKARMSQREYAQEYLGEFLDELMRYFSDDLILKCCILKRREGCLKNREYSLGVDIARMGEDESTFEIIDGTNRDRIIHVESIVQKKKLTTETEDKIISLVRQYDEIKKVYIDAGAGTLGVSVFDHLLRIDETKRKIVAINNRARSYDRDDKQKARLLKEDLYDNLRSLMEKGEIKLLDDDKVIESLRSIQYEYVQKSGQPTRLRIFGSYAHIAEGLIRAAWFKKEKGLNISIRSIRA